MFLLSASQCGFRAVGLYACDIPAIDVCGIPVRPETA